MFQRFNIFDRNTKLFESAGYKQQKIQSYYNKYSLADNQKIGMSKKPTKKQKNDKEKWDVAQLKTVGSPVDISLPHCTKHLCPPLEMQYYDAMPTSLEMVNTGSTVLINGVYHKDRPCLVKGPLQDKYIFIQMHFHWGTKVTAGSEHSIEGERLMNRYAMELHVVHFKREYIYPEEAKKKEDGLVVIAYLMKFQPWDNPSLFGIINNLGEIRKANSSFSLTPAPLQNYTPNFSDDFFIYRGVIDILETRTAVIWIIPRHPIGISDSQVKEFYNLLNPNNKPIRENSRQTSPSSKGDVAFINPSGAQFSTMRQFPFP